MFGSDCAAHCHDGPAQRALHLRSATPAAYKLAQLLGAVVKRWGLCAQPVQPTLAPEGVPRGTLPLA